MTEPAAPSNRCEAAHRDDRRPCDSPPVVRVVDSHGGSATGCLVHAPTLLAAVSGSAVYPLPGHEGKAVEAFKRADRIRTGGVR